MNISGLMIPAFKEFGGLNRIENQHWQRPNLEDAHQPHAKNKQENASESRYSTPFASQGDLRQIFRGFDPRYATPFRHRGFRNDFQQKQQILSTQDTLARLDAQSTHTSKQSTTLSIQTKDGDVVTLRIKEKGYRAESVEIKTTENKEEPRTNTVQIGVQHKEQSFEKFNLDAILQGEELSDTEIKMKSKNESVSEVQYRSSNEDETTVAQYQVYTKSRSHLEFEVEGNLDKEELVAISELLNDVNDLADTFYNGDIQSAFQQAGQLDYDDSEIASYSLSLKEKETSAAAEVYQFHQPTEEAIPHYAAKPIGNYLGQLEEVLNQSNQRIDSDVLLSIMESVDRLKTDFAWPDDDDQKVGKFREFNEHWLRKIQTHRN